MKERWLQTYTMCDVSLHVSSSKTKLTRSVLGPTSRAADNSPGRTSAMSSMNTPCNNCKENTPSLSSENEIYVRRATSNADLTLASCVPAVDRTPNEMRRVLGSTHIVLLIMRPFMYSSICMESSEYREGKNSKNKIKI
jgi:hypothetical protein